MLDIQNPNWLRNAMAEAGLQSGDRFLTGELSERAKVSRSQIQRILNGMEPRMGTLRRITAALEQAKEARS